MVVYTVTPDICTGDCHKVFSFLEIQFPYIEPKRDMKVGPYVIPRNIIENAQYPYICVIRPGERCRFAKIKDKEEYIYFDYPRRDRVYMDYEKYVKIYKFMKSLNLKKLKVDGITFYYRPLPFDKVTNDYDQFFDDKYFHFGVQKEQPVFTKDGVVTIYSETITNLDKGECRVVFGQKYIPFCYGDP